jgi:hypothetical protein
MRPRTSGTATHPALCNAAVDAGCVAASLVLGQARARRDSPFRHWSTLLISLLGTTPGLDEGSPYSTMHTVAQGFTKENLVDMVAHFASSP